MPAEHKAQYQVWSRMTDPASVMKCWAVIASDAVAEHLIEKDGVRQVEAYAS